MNRDQVEAEDEANLSMIEEKARSLLNWNERQILSRCCHAYGHGHITIDHFIETLLNLLNTPDKITFLVELRELVRDEDKSRYDYKVFVLRKPFHVIQFQTNNSFDFQSTDGNQCLLQVNVQNSTKKRKQNGKEVVPKEIKSNGNHSTRTLNESTITLLPDITSAFPSAPLNTVQELPTGPKEKLVHFTEQYKEHKRITYEEPEELMQISIAKTKASLGIAIEGGANTGHPLPRIISIDGKGTAFDAAGLKIGQTIVEVDGISMEGLSHDEAARIIAERYADKTRQDLVLTVTANSFRPHAELYRPNS